MKKETKFALHTIAAVLFAGLVLSGAYAKETKKPSALHPKTIIVGTGADYKPYCYLNSNGKLVGFEKDVLDAVDELLPQYTFTYQTFEFKDILIALAAGKVDIGAHQWESNPQRQKTYLFSTVPYTSYSQYIVVPNDNTTIKELKDLAGKNIQAGVGSNKAFFVEKYNKEHPDQKPIIVEYSAPTDEELMAGIHNGKWDALITIKRNVDLYNKEYNAGLKIVGEPIINSSAYYLFHKGDSELQTAVDGALKQLKQSGKLSELSVRDLGGDYIVK